MQVGELIRGIANSTTAMPQANDVVYRFESCLRKTIRVVAMQNSPFVNVCGFNIKPV